MIVAFAVVMGAAALSDALQDAFGARCLRWVSAVIAMLLIVDVLVLVGVLGLRSLADANGANDNSAEKPAEPRRPKSDLL